MSTSPVIQVARPGTRFQRLFEECCRGITDGDFDAVCKALNPKNWKATKRWALRYLKTGKARGWSDQSYTTHAKHIGFTWRYEYANCVHRITEAKDLSAALP